MQDVEEAVHHARQGVEDAAETAKEKLSSIGDSRGATWEDVKKSAEEMRRHAREKVEL